MPNERRHLWEDVLRGVAEERAALGYLREILQCGTEPAERVVRGGAVGLAALSERLKELHRLEALERRGLVCAAAEELAAA